MTDQQKNEENEVKDDGVEVDSKKKEDESTEETDDSEAAVNELNESDEGQSKK